MLRLAPNTLPPRDATEGPGLFAAPAGVARAGRVALLSGCVQSVVRPAINAAAIRVLNRLGYDVVLAKGDECCGSLAHHMGHESRGLAHARATIDAWMAEVEGKGLDAIIVTASGCGATIKDYGAMLADDPAYAAKAQRIAALAKDVSEFLAPHDFAGAAAPALTLAYQAPCSLQHAQKLMDAPRSLLRKIGFAVRDIPEAHLCCGSAGVYNILQPETGDALRARKLAAIGKVKSDAIVTANVGCLTQLALESKLPIAHAVEYVDWAWGGPRPF
jgi:glycolate oxidase iron-sulfur subunit